ncbi:MAG: hypothetical protein LUI07_07055, partial [Lachnospiraceae bacterium]|nr:hypothetical protein [Lachnospiraceae bacterium]
ILSAEAFGMSDQAVNDKYYIACNGANIYQTPLHQPDAEPVIACESCYYRILPDGFEQRTMFWIGLHFRDGHSEISLPDNKPVNPMMAAALARHSAWETATLMRNVMAFWEDRKVGTI